MCTFLIDELKLELYNYKQKCTQVDEKGDSSAMKSEYEVYKRIFDKYNGVIKTSEFKEEGYHHSILKKLVDEGIIVKIKRGYYEWQEEFISDATIITRLYSEAVVYLNSALFIYGYIDRTPNEWHLAVNRGSARLKFDIDYPKVKTYYINKEYMSIGKIEYIYEEQSINIFDRDRTICDTIRYSNKMDKELINQAIKNYLNDSKKNIGNLMTYARMLRSESKVKTMIGVWL